MPFFQTPVNRHAKPVVLHSPVSII
jgi:hypothetical protein